MIDTCGTLGSPSTHKSMMYSGICFFEPLKVPRPGRPQVKSLPLTTVHSRKLQGSRFFMQRLCSVSMAHGTARQDSKFKLRPYRLLGAPAAKFCLPYNRKILHAFWRLPVDPAKAKRGWRRVEAAQRP